MRVTPPDGTILNFDQMVGQSISSQVIDVTNTSHEILNVTASLEIGTTFQATGSTAFTLKPGERRQINIRFAPNEAKAYSDTITIQANDEIVRINLAGIGIYVPPFSCSAANENPPQSFLGDAAALATLLSLLLIMSRGKTA